LINKIHSILFTDTDCRELEQKMGPFDKKLFSTERRIDGTKFLKFLFNAIINDPNDNDKKVRKKSIEIQEISKKVPRWSYKLIKDFEQQQERENQEDGAVQQQIRSRKGKRVVIFTNNQENIDTETNNSNQKDEVALIRYSQQSDFRRNIIKGSMRAQRRKTVIGELFQANVHSPLFLDRIDKSLFFSFDISRPMKLIFKNWKEKKRRIQNFRL